VTSAAPRIAGIVVPEHMTLSYLETELDFAALLDEAVDLLREYLTIDTTNPPGDVSRAADWVESLLRSEGFSPQRVGPSASKPSVVATLDSRVARQSLVLAHHMDVVPAVREDWSVEPFGGDLRDGFVWGRGTLDMKGFGVMTMVCAFALKRLGVPLTRPLRLLATADEEVGGIDGAKWLAEHHLEDVGGEFLLTEGAFAKAGPRATYYAVQVAEKGVSTIKLTARGQPGHASAPRDDNAVVRIARALARIGGYRSPPAARDLARRYLSAFPPQVLQLQGGRTIADLGDKELEELLAMLSGGSRIQNMLRNTFVPTMVHAGLGQNVIPPVCEAHVDCRTVPGVASEQLLEEIASVIDDGTIELELVKSSAGTESPVDSELFDAVREAVAAERPGALVVPYLTAGGTDCKHFRPHGIVSYGHIPFELEDSETDRIHGIDERVSVENLERGLRILFGVVARMCVQKAG
jgi:acetylornithine deacetylase/succinyl-diaminopimelate desuccinylase-like protein